MATILDASVSFQSRRLIQPLHLSSGKIEVLTQATTIVVVEVDGKRAVGQGTVYLSDLWAWPDEALPHDTRVAAMRQLCEMIARELPRYFRDDAHHPLELGLRLHHWSCRELALTPSPPALARALCASPFDAAIHDAVGLAREVSAFALYATSVDIPSADALFPGHGACRSVADVIGPPRCELPAWYVVGMAEPVQSTLVPAIAKHGYRCFKLKLSGRDNAADVTRTVEVFQTAKARGIVAPRLAVDTNEANPSANSVLEYLDRLESADAGAFAAVEYFEQPTSRDIRKHPFDWRAVRLRKPVLLDEGLAELELLPEALHQGYSGLALKTCKGHSTLLVAAAWARRHRMLITLQDLTNPGIALIHGALVGAYLPTLNGAELNSPQFTPAANAEFLPRLGKLFEPRHGVHRLPDDLGYGLGSGW
jgi:L-alanine-DL-glutamate epimerase-like enolase superfamily enzyme